MNKQQEIKEYFKSNRLNQTLFKKLLEGIHSYNKYVKERAEIAAGLVEEKISESFVIGSGVDMLITIGEQSYLDSYIILDSLPSEDLQSVFKWAVQYIKISNIAVDEQDESQVTTHKSTLLKAWKSLGYDKTIKKEETRTSKLLKYEEYFKTLLFNNDNKVIITKKDDSLIRKIADNIKNHPFTAPYFKQRKGVDILYQVIIYFEYRGIPCKAMLDMVIIDHNKQNIIPIDIKTLSDYTTSFHKSVYKYRYDIQAAFYTIAISQHFKKYIDQGYTVGDKNSSYKFIVESTTVPGTPLVYNLTAKDLLIGKEGLTISDIETNGLLNLADVLYRRKSDIKGLDHAIDLYIWHTENGLYNYSKEIYENNGEMTLDIWR